MQDRVTAILFPNAGCLTGLVECVKRSNMTINALSSQLKVHFVTIERAFETGDIKISILKRIARMLGIEIKWIWLPVENRTA
jgi:hypothetical protein